MSSGLQHCLVACNDALTHDLSSLRRHSCIPIQDIWILHQAVSPEKPRYKRVPARRGGETDTTMHEGIRHSGKGFIFLQSTLLTSFLLPAATAL